MDRQEQIRREEQQHQEHVELLESFGQLQEQMATWEADRQAERIEHAREIAELQKARADIYKRLGKSSYRCCKQHMDRQRFSRY